MLGNESGRRPERRSRAGKSLAKVVGTLRRIAGMPDYSEHVEHLRRCHPERPVPSERQYFEDFICTRYGDGPTRCC